MCLPVATLPVLLLQGSQSTKHSETASESDSQSCLSGKETSSGCRKRSWQLCQAKRSVDAHRAPNTLLRPRFIPFLSFFSYLLIYIFVYEGPRSAKPELYHRTTSPTQDLDFWDTVFRHFLFVCFVVWISLNSKEDTQTLFFIEFMFLLFYVFKCMCCQKEQNRLLKTAVKKNPHLVDLQFSASCL